MLHSRLVFGFFVLILLIPAYVTANSKNTCQNVKRADVLKWVEQIKEYETTVILRVQGALIDFKSQVYGRSPDRLRIDMDMGNDKMSIKQKTLFDGTYQWNEASSDMGSQITKLKLDKVANKDKPFDTFMYVVGSGLMNGEDLPTTLKTLFEIYKVSAQCDKKKTLTIFTGRLDADKYRKYIAKSKYAKQRKLGIDNYINNFTQIQISVDPKSKHVKSYSMGNSETKPTYAVTFKNMKTNGKLPENIFTYKLPAGEQAIDITDDLVEKLH